MRAPKLKPSKAHPGFQGAAESIASREGLSMGAAKAILASSARGASNKARRANPRLNRVKR